MKVCLIRFVVCLICALAIGIVYYIGRIDGMAYTIEKSQIYSDSNYIYIELDGDLYVHDRK